MVTALTTGATASDVARLAGYGVRFIYLPAPADPRLSADFDEATSVLGPASSLRPGSRAWELLPHSTGGMFKRDVDPHRDWLVALQLFGAVLVLILAAPGRRRTT